MIITARDYAKQRHGVDTVKERILAMQAQHASKGLRYRVLDIDKPSGVPVLARLENGQWIADCECKGAQFVDYREPIFFCTDCANRDNENRVRPVKFPKKRAEIEALLLKRPVKMMRGIDDLQRVEASQAEIFVEGKGFLSRSWTPGETLADLRKQQDKPIAEWKKSKAGK